MAARHLVRHLLNAHAIASYSGAIVAAAILCGFQFREFVGYAFPIFLAPLVLPIGMMIENEKQLLICATDYILAFWVTLVFLRRRQRRWDIEAESLIASAQAEPNEKVLLAYYSALALEAESYGKIELIAAGSAIISIFAAVACLGIQISRENSGRDPLGIWVLWLLLLPASVATITGLVGCFKTNAHTRPRSVAFIGLTAGAVMVLMFAYLLYSYLTGIYKYD